MRIDPWSKFHPGWFFVFCLPLFLSVFSSCVADAPSQNAYTRNRKNLDVSDARKLYDIAVIGACEDAWAVGYFGTVLHSDDCGLTWRTVKVDGKNGFFGVDFADKAIGWIVGEAGVILHTRDGGASWVKQKNPFPGDDLLKVKSWGVTRVGATATIAMLEEAMNRFEGKSVPDFKDSDADRVKGY